MERILATHEDELGAMKRPGLGDVDFRKEGIFHLVPRRDRQGELSASLKGLKGEDVARQMPEVIARGHMSPPYWDKQNRHWKRNIDWGAHRAIIQLDFDGERRAWLLSGYQKT